MSFYDTVQPVLRAVRPIVVGANRALVSSLVCAVFCSTILSGQAVRKEPPLPPGQAAVFLRSRAVCTGRHGPYLQLWVAVLDVSARLARTGQWQDLTPGLSTHPLMLDLLQSGGVSVPLGGNPRLPAGTYDALRLRLGARPAAQPAASLCTVHSPCVVLQYGTAVPLTLPGGDTVEIGFGRMAGGALQVKANQTANLTLFWDACASIQPITNYEFQLAPVLWAAAGAPGSGGVIQGRVVDAATGLPVEGGNVMIALESSGVGGAHTGGASRPLMVTSAAPDGSFAFDDVPRWLDSAPAGDQETPGGSRGEAPQNGGPAAWQVVIAAISRLNAAYAPVLVSGVPAGTDLGAIGLVVSTTTNNAPVSLFGQVETPWTGQPLSGAIQVSAVVPYSAGGFTLPLMQQGQALAVLAPQPDVTCSAGMLCSGYTLSISGFSPRIGEWQPALGHVIWLQEPEAVATYRIEAAWTGACRTLPQSVDVETAPGSFLQLPTFTLGPCR